LSKYELDKFYTKLNIAKTCIDSIDISKFKTIIEPSAGDGSFSNQIDCYSFDLDPKGVGITKQDFLTLDYSSFETPILIIGNPPFGRQSSLALKFIKYAAKFADTIAFILPRSFKKKSLQYKVPLNFWLVKEFDIEEKSFIYNGEEVSIPCVWQIWVKKDHLRRSFKKKYSTSFKFVEKEKANCSIRRVGFYAGKAFKGTEKSKQSHYFINVDCVNDFIEKVNNVAWEHNNTIGPRSISKQELIDKID